MHRPSGKKRGQHISLSTERVINSISKMQERDRHRLDSPSTDGPPEHTHTHTHLGNSPLRTTRITHRPAKSKKPSLDLSLSLSFTLSVFLSSLPSSRSAPSNLVLVFIHLSARSPILGAVTTFSRPQRFVSQLVGRLRELHTPLDTCPTP